MPVQKGKKRRKVRSRGVERVGTQDAPSPPATKAPTAKASAAKKPRRTMPTWMKFVMGVFMLAAGVFFFIWDSRTASQGSRLLFLVIYLVIAGLYLQSGIRDYLAGRT